MATKTQYRAECSVCFRDQCCVRRGRRYMVAHGYQLPGGLGVGQVGECSGSGRPHFGTVEGKAIAASAATDLEFRGAEQTTLANRPDDKLRVYERQWNGPMGCHVPVLLGKPTEGQIRQQRSRHLMLERQYGAAAVEIRKRIAVWKAVEPRLVEVGS